MLQPIKFIGPVLKIKFIKDFFFKFSKFNTNFTFSKFNTNFIFSKFNSKRKWLFSYFSCSDWSHGLSFLFSNSRPLPHCWRIGRGLLGTAVEPRFVKSDLCRIDFSFTGSDRSIVRSYQKFLIAFKGCNSLINHKYTTNIFIYLQNGA